MKRMKRAHLNEADKHLENEKQNLRMAKKEPEQSKTDKNKECRTKTESNEERSNHKTKIKNSDEDNNLNDELESRLTEIKK